MCGTIIKGIGGFYYIKTEKMIIECKARGKFRFNGLTPMVGDKVEISIKNSKGVIEKIYDRTSELYRPAVANVNQAFIVFSIKHPDINLELLNRFLILCEFKKIKPIICINKMDLVNDNEIIELIEMIKGTNYEYVILKAKENIGLEYLKSKLDNNITVLCGPSGVGKSTILNKLSQKEIMETGKISEKVNRGKHTTRHSELIEVEEGFIVDTPGFSSLDINFIQKYELQFAFPEFDEIRYECKFSGCLHYKEPSCAVKHEVENGKINEKRYKFYIKLLEEILNKQPKY